MKKYEIIAMGGTFDIIHDGHMELLSKAFSISNKTIIGLTSDELAVKKGKNLLKNYHQRFESLKSVIEKKFPESSYEISKLENDFGPAVIEGSVQALIVSEETNAKGLLLNQMRTKRNLPLVEIVVVPMVLAEDGGPISTTRIKNSEIDTSGNLN
jgi:pantetheine-phosphate adenylyltransferase